MGAFHRLSEEGTPTKDLFLRPLLGPGRNRDNPPLDFGWDGGRKSIGSSVWNLEGAGVTVRRTELLFPPKLSEAIVEGLITWRQPPTRF